MAGRVMLNRPQGRLAFATLRDSSGQIQLFALEKIDGGLRRLLQAVARGLGGGDGRVVKTRKGELSVQVREWVLLAEARRSFGDKWKGVTDTETRFRQREVDLWANERAGEVLRLRSRVVSSLRRRLEAEGFVEVETPILHVMAGGATAKPFVTHHNALDTDLFLRIAPELFLKRLVVGGFEKVFEIGRVFRNEGLSPRHNPEFTMLELYQAYADYHDFMVLVEELVAGLASELQGTTCLTYQGRTLDLTPPWRRATMAELVTESTGEEASVHTPVDDLRRRVAAAGVEPDRRWGPGKLLLELYEKTTEPGPVGAGVRHRLPGRGVAPGAPSSPRPRSGREVRTRRGRARARKRLLRARRSRRPAGTLRGAGRGARRRATTRPWPSTRTTSGPWSSGCRPRPGWASASTAW